MAQYTIEIDETFDVPRRKAFAVFADHHACAADLSGSELTLLVIVGAPKQAQTYGVIPYLIIVGPRFLLTFVKIDGCNRSPLSP